MGINVNRFSLLFPAIILALCCLELSLGNLVQLRVVYFFYIYFFYFICLRVQKAKFYFNALAVTVFALTIVSYISAVFISSGFFLTNKSELINILWWSLFALMVSTELHTDQNRLQFIRYFAVVLYVGSLFSSSMGLIKLALIEWFGIIIDAAIYDEDTLIFGAALHADYNLYALGIFLGGLCGKFLADCSPPKSNIKKLSWITLPIIFTAMILSGSRRAIFFSMFLIIIFIFFDLGNGRTIKDNFREKGLKIVFAITSIAASFIVFLNAIEELIISKGFISGLSRLLTIRQDFGGKNDRTERLEFAEQFFDNLNPLQWVFGQGFDYLGVFGKALNFGKDDHPHNFIVSTMIYGGIVAVILLLMLIFISLKFYYTNHAYSLLYLLLFFLLLFSLTSTNTLFSFRVFPIVVLLAGLSKRKYADVSK